jgi:2-dehydro-3-deoxygluconokinase
LEKTSTGAALPATRSTPAGISPRSCRKHGRVDYFTRVGNDAFSSEFLDFLAGSGLASDSIARDAERSIGLYVIRLAGAERSFSCWRDSAAARRLADDYDKLSTAISGAGLIHISGITLAIIGEAGRRNLLKALDAARSGGSMVSYDPNVRPRLWRDAAEMQSALREVLGVTDIALPSFDDEAKLWGDGDPEATVKRMTRAGVREIAVKNGQNSVALFIDGSLSRVPTQEVSNIRDTTGAGDSFNDSVGSLPARARRSGRDHQPFWSFGSRTRPETILSEDLRPRREKLKPNKNAPHLRADLFESRQTPLA